MLFIDGIVFSLQKSGGISVCFVEILKRLRIDTYFLMYANENHALKEVDSTLRSNIERMRSPIGANALKILRYMDVIVPKNVTVFHSSYYRIPVFWQRSKVKVITTVHDFTYERMFSGFSAVIHRWQKKRAILNSDVIVCISENTKRDLLLFYPDASRKDIHVIYNGVSKDFFPLKDKTPEKENYVLYVGARGGYKNFDALVIAMSRIKNLKLIFVGGGSVSVAEHNLLNQNLKGRYEHYGYVDNKILNELYNSAFCFVYPSLYEGFGIPVVEAMSAGCPVVASSSSSIPEVAGDAALLVESVTADAVYAAINRLFDIEFRCNLIERGFSNAKKFNWELTYNKLSQLY